MSSPPDAPGTTPIAVVVVDDHAVFRDGLRALLDRVDAMRVVGEAGTTDDAVSVTNETSPDVVLMDLHLPGAGGADATRRILDARPSIAVLALTMHSDDAHLRSALAAGARGYLLKDAAPDAIVHAIIAVHDGQMVLDGGVTDRLLSASLSSVARAFPALTDREYALLDRLARGLRNDVIAERMGVSMKTVQNNVSAILLKLGAGDRAQAVAIARDAGLGTGPLH